MDENKSAEATNEREVSFNNVSEASNVTNEVPSKQQQKKKPKTKIVVAILAAVLLLGCGAIGSYPWYQNYDPTQDSIDVEGKTRDEIQEEVNKRTAESMMAINMTSEVRIDEDGKVYIDFSNDNTEKEDPNSWYQRFEIVQDNNVVYTSDVVKPGDKIEYFEDKDGKLKEGEAKVVVYRCKQLGKQIGSNATVELNIVDLRS